MTDKDALRSRLRSTGMPVQHADIIADETIEETAAVRARSSTKKQEKPLKALSLFSGCGGFCEGMRLAGCQIALAVELDRFACESLRYNFPEHKVFEGDIKDFNDLSAKERTSLCGVGDVDVVFGGPPCQGYSQIGTRDISDPRNKLYLEFVRTIKQERPLVFVMENVPNMLLLRKGIYRDAAVKAFNEAGYDPVVPVLMHAKDFGVPQDRRRVFYFGVRSDLKFRSDLKEFVDAAVEPCRVSQPTTVWEAIGDLPAEITDSGELLPYPAQRRLTPFMREMRIDTEGGIYSRAMKLDSGIATWRKQHPNRASPLLNHHTKEIQERRLALIKLLEPGKKADSLPKHIWDNARPEKWRRLHPDRVSHTILAQMHRDLSEFVHPKLDRWITVREALRLQSFHDGFIPVTSEWQQLKQIGNAVPPLLAHAVGHVVQRIIQEVRGLAPQEMRPVQVRLFSGAA
jgi:DNA (cytosine-5)-methyltransferase 1